ncbi:MAG: DinB family protein [Candidatus Acidiferrum sp.]
MNKTTALLLSLSLLFCTGLALAQDPKPSEHPSVAQILDHSIAGVEGEFVSAAEAMPEDKYSFAPTNGEFKNVRTFAQQVKHVAAVNYLVGAAILQEKPPIELSGESGPDSIRTKVDIVKFLKESFTYVHKAVGIINDGILLNPVKSPFGEGMVTRLGLATLIVGHCFDHYGQMVVYLRMNSIVPPASR